MGGLRPERTAPSRFSTCAGVALAFVGLRTVDVSSTTGMANWSWVGRLKPIIQPNIALAIRSSASAAFRAPVVLPPPCCDEEPDQRRPRHGNRQNEKDIVWHLQQASKRLHAISVGEACSVDLVLNLQG